MSRKSAPLSGDSGAAEDCPGNRPSVPPAVRQPVSLPVRVYFSGGRFVDLPLAGAGDSLTANGQALTKFIYLSGLFEPPPLCSGLGRCGRCRMRFLPQSVAVPEPLPEDFEILGGADVAQGWRLGCRHVVFPGAVLELPGNIRVFSDCAAKRLDEAEAAAAPNDSPDAGAGLYSSVNAHARQAVQSYAVTVTGRVIAAVDFGSTSVQYELLPEVQGEQSGQGGQSGGNDFSGASAAVSGVASASGATGAIDITGAIDPAGCRGSLVNPQMGAGSDIMSRLAYAAAEPGRAQLAALSRLALGRIATAGERRVTIPEAGNGMSCSGAFPVDCALTGGAVAAGALGMPDLAPDGMCAEMVIATNPAMAYLILGRDAAGLRGAPYHLDYRGGVSENLPGLPPLWFCPLISPFVGGDISAGYAFLTYGGGDVKGGETPCAKLPADEIYPFLLADLGTNGEFLLALDSERALAASLPLGPALEGMGMSCGAEARGNTAAGAVTAFTLGPLGLEPKVVPPGSAPSGISATGYLSLLRNLRKLGLLDEDGLFVKDFSALSPLARRVSAGLRPRGTGMAWFLNGDFHVSAADVEELLKVKAAFRLALDALLKEAALPPGGLRHVFLAGNLGLHADTEDLTALGFVPEALRGRIVPVGNSSLAGARLLARHADLREPLCRWAAGVRTLDLTAAPNFHEFFAAAMNLRQEPPISG